MTYSVSAPRGTDDGQSSRSGSRRACASRAPSAGLVGLGRRWSWGGCSLTLVISGRFSWPGNGLKKGSLTLSQLVGRGPVGEVLLERVLALRIGPAGRDGRLVDGGLVLVGHCVGWTLVKELVSGSVLFAC